MIIIGRSRSDATISLWLTELRAINQPLVIPAVLKLSGKPTKMNNVPVLHSAEMASPDLFKCQHTHTHNHVVILLLVTKETKLYLNVGHGGGKLFLTGQLCV